MSMKIRWIWMMRMDGEKTTLHLQCLLTSSRPVCHLASREVWGRECGVGVTSGWATALSGLASVQVPSRALGSRDYCRLPSFGDFSVAHVSSLFSSLKWKGLITCSIALLHSPMSDVRCRSMASPFLSQRPH
jgi:hypothetical protein